MSNQEIINIGTLPNDGEGDPLRVAFGKINNNFTNLFSTSTSITNSYTYGNVVNQVIFETPIDVFTQAQFYIRTSEVISNDSQTIQLYAQSNNDNTNVKFTGYGTTYFGNALASFDMDVNAGNIRILADPIVDKELLHSVAVSIMYQGEITQGVPLGLDGFSGSVMGTEDDQAVTTE
jgi:hypothetical protein